MNVLISIFGWFWKSIRPLRVMVSLTTALVLSALFIQVSAQNQNKTLVAPVIPPSPDAASLGKYGSTPVGLHTGIPSIDIPLFTIKSGRLEVPISISYHASGVKVSEVASWVGLGWTLNAGGAISRSVVGGPDDASGFWSTTIKKAQNIDILADHAYLKSVADGSADAESDYYFYNFNGRSGKFVYPQNDNQHPFLIPQAPIKINYVSGHYEIIDEAGTRYVFAANESATLNNQQGTVTYTSSYYLSEIISADGQDHISFHYSGGFGYVDDQPVFTETVGEQCFGSNPVPNDGFHGYDYYVTSRSVAVLQLSEITYKHGKVEFISDTTRSDRPSSRLNEIRIFSNQADGSTSLLKSYSFGESYFVSPPATSKDHYRLKLPQLIAKDESGKIINSYGFVYNESVSMPERKSLAQDWWGLYNGQILNQSLIKGEAVNFLEQNYNVGGYPSNSVVREPNASTMQAFMLNKIIYPTGGYTEFEYEPHRYLGTQTTPVSRSTSSGAVGNTTTLLQNTITFTPATSGPARLSTLCSDVTDASPFYSTVKLRKQNDTQYLVNHIYDYTIVPHPPQLTKEFTVNLIAGTTYELTVMSKGNSNSDYYSKAAFSQATLYWGEVTSGVAVMAGGLRIKELRDFEKVGATPIRKIYKYGNNESGYGELLIPEYGMNISRQEINFEYTVFGAVFGEATLCEPVCSGKKLVLSGRPPLELTSLNGAPVVYAEVTVYEENNITKPNGKQVFRFDVQPDQFYFTDKAYNNGRLQTNESWRGGDEIGNTMYIGSSTGKTKENSSTYAIYNPTEIVGTKVGWRVSFEGCGFPSIVNNTILMNSHYFYFHDYPIFSGSKKISVTSERDYSSANGSAYRENTVNYYYDNMDSDHQQLTRTITRNSDADEMKTQYWYPGDYDGSTENINTLLSRNIIAIPIKEEQYQNNQLIGGKVTRMDDYGNPKEIYQYESVQPQPAPTHLPSIIVPTGYSKRADVTYDNMTRKVKAIQYSNDISTTYLWGYNNTLPIAEVKNAEMGPATTYSLSNIVGKNITTAGTLIQLTPTFEIVFDQTITPSLSVTVLGTSPPPNPLLTIYLKRSDGTIMKTHNCTWGSNSIGSIVLTPGSYQWSYSTNLTTGNGFNGDRLDITTNYQGQLSGHKTVYTSFEENGIVDNTAFTGKRVWSGTYSLKLPGYAGSYKLTYWRKLIGNNPWTLVEQTATVAAGNYEPTITIGTAGYLIDEVRVTPPGAVMTTYSYDPLKGITSLTDPNNSTAYYGYDSFGRLQLIKDHKGNIIKRIDYHFKGN